MAYPAKIDPVVLERLWHQGALLRHIAAEFGVTESAVCKTAQMLGLRRWSVPRSERAQ